MCRKKEKGLQPQALCYLGHKNFHSKGRDHFNWPLEAESDTSITRVKYGVISPTAVVRDCYKVFSAS